MGILAHVLRHNNKTPTYKQCLLLLNKSRPSPASRPPRFSPSPSPRLSRLTSTRNSVPTRVGANPRSSRLATKRTPSVKSSTADGPNWASPAPGPPRTAPVSRGSPRVPCAPRMTAPPSRTSSRAPSPRWRRPALATRPSNVLIIETVLVGAAEAYRTGLAANPFDDGLVAGDVSPGGRFDPLGLAESGDLEELKIKELKHCRLSMFAWLGCIMQALATQEGPIANWTAHTADPVHANVLTNAAKGFGFY